MKKLFFSLLFAGLLAASCTNPLALDGTSWVPYMFEDMFDGSVVCDGNVTGNIEAAVYEGHLYLYLTIPELGIKNVEYTPDDYRIIRQSSSELVLELLPYYYYDLRRSDCTEEFMVNGKLIYSFVYDGYPTYVYFKPGGTAVEIYEEDYLGPEPYYFDATRIYCRIR